LARVKIAADPMLDVARRPSSSRHFGFRHFSPNHCFFVKCEIFPAPQALRHSGTQALAVEILFL